MEDVLPDNPVVLEPAIEWDDSGVISRAFPPPDGQGPDTTDESDIWDRLVPTFHSTTPAAPLHCPVPTGRTWSRTRRPALRPDVEFPVVKSTIKQATIKLAITHAGTSVDTIVRTIGFSYDSDIPAVVLVWDGSPTYAVLYPLARAFDVVQHYVHEMAASVMEHALATEWPVSRAIFHVATDVTIKKSLIVQKHEAASQTQLNRIMTDFTRYDLTKWIDAVTPLPSASVAVSIDDLYM